MLDLELWTTQRTRWPATGRHILAQYTDDWVVVYQAYRPDIAEWAVAHQAFGGPWSFSRMTWVKPNFMWMMYRCGWATKPGQERVLAIKLARAGFDTILEDARQSSAPPGISVEEWRRTLAKSDVRLQWDPDHGPNGEKLERRAIQLGLRGQTTKRFSSEWIVEIEDITGFVHEQHQVLHTAGREHILCPLERVYTPTSTRAAQNVRLDPPPAS